jgi:hypothetical protein
MIKVENEWYKNAEPICDSKLDKYLVVVLDLESDYGAGGTDCLDKADHVIKFLKDKVVEFTVFCEGNILKSRHSTIELIEAAGGDMQLHCNDHLIGNDDVGEFKKGLNEYIKYFNRVPDGYRAGQFKMKDELFKAIKDAGIKWDSSLLPVFNSKIYNTPLVFKDGFIEFPASVWSGLRYPVGMSYCSVVGPALFNLLIKKAKTMSYLNFTIHMHDLIPSQSLQNASFARRLAHRWNYRFGVRDPFDFFVKIINDYLDIGFTPISLNRLYSILTT